MGALEADAPQPSLLVARSDRRMLVAAVGTGLLLGALDGAVISTSLPRIVTDLGAIEWAGWVAGAYLLGAAVATPAWGSIGDVRGHRTVLRWGLAGLLAATLTCALAGFPGREGSASAPIELIVARLAQGIASAAIFTSSFALIAELYPLRRRARHAGRFSTVFAAAALAGPVVAGVITDGLTVELWGTTIAGWRFVFLLQIPLIALAYAAAESLPAKVPEPVPLSFDFLGTATIAFVLLCSGALLGELHPEGNRVVAAAAGAAMLVGLASLAWVERRAERPVLPPTLVSLPMIGSACLAGAACTAALLCVAISVPAALQLQLGFSASESGFMMAMFASGLAVGAIAGGQLLARTGACRNVAAAAIVVAIAGTALLGLAPQPDMWIFAAQCSIAGLGFGPLQSVFAIAAQHGAPDGRRGSATAVVQFSRRTGATIGALAGGLIILSAATGKSPAAGAAWGEALRSPTAAAVLFLAIALAAVTAMPDDRLPRE